MKMDFNLQMTQQQKLIMTQQMQLSVKILQMSAYELNQYINKEVQENPVIDIEYQENNEQKKDIKDIKKIINNLEYTSYKNDYSYNNEKISPLDFITSKKTLKEYLKDQLLMLNIDKNIKTICEYIIENLNHIGYLDETINNIAKELKSTDECVEKSMRIVQSFEPYGVGARDLKECLKIQLNRRNVKDSNLFIIIDNYLEVIAENKYTVISKELGINVREAQKYGDIIKSLEPKPSRGFYTGEETKYIIPDAYIKKIGNEYYIIMNEAILPKLNINTLYKNIVNSEKNVEDGETVNYVKEKLNKAMFLIKSIEQRKSTLYRVLEEVINIQRDYFDFGKNYLKPMTLKDIANELNLHESTISRAIKDKYINTSNGTIKIKDLFTSGISSKYGEESVSTVNIKRVIKEIIDKEDKKSPLSDEKISKLLKENNIKISRRTVAKYREELGIKASSKRKRF